MSESERLEMFKNNQALVPAFLKDKWYSKFLEKEDLMQEGYLILWECTDTYDPSSGNTFATYVYSKLQFGLHEYSNRWRFGNKNPSSYSDAMSAASYAYKHNMKIEDVCEERKLTPYQSHMAQLISSGSSYFVHLDEKVKDNGDNHNRSLHELIPDGTDVENETCDKLYNELIEESVKTDFVEWYLAKHGGLKPEVNRVLLNEYVKCVFGEGDTIAEIAKRHHLSFNVTRVRFAKYRQYLREWAQTTLLVKG